MIRSEAIRLPFSYATGPVGEAYLDGLGQGRLLASRCQPCSKVLSPARSLCPFCGQSCDGQLIETGPGGVVVSWTGAAGHPALVLVRLDGADTAILHQLTGPARPAVGDRVIATLRAGSFSGFEVEAR